MLISPLQLAVRFRVDDLSGADVPCSRLQNILTACSTQKRLTEFSEVFLRSLGLSALIAFAKGEVDEETFQVRAAAEQVLRRDSVEKKRRLQVEKAELAAAEREARRAAMYAEQEAARRREELDPRNIARRRNKALREKYGVRGYVDEDAYPQLMEILKDLDAARRLPEASVAWLAATGREYRTSEIIHAFHRLEADHFLQEFKVTGNAWHAVSASKNLRKCTGSQEAHDMLSKIPKSRLNQAKLKSAVCTTHGGALRDLHRYAEAMHQGEQAHALVESNFMPCTLLGAIHIELGQIAEGHEWYAKAEARGAPRDGIDREVRAILSRLPPAKRAEIVAELLTHDARRYERLSSSFRA